MLAHLASHPLSRVLLSKGSYSLVYLFPAQRTCGGTLQWNTDLLKPQKRGHDIESIAQRQSNCPVYRRLWALFLALKGE